MSKPLKDKNISIPDNVLAKLLTPSEVRMLKNRWKILGLLEKGLSIRKISTEAEVGTDTVVRIIRLAERNDLLKKIINEPKRKMQSSTPWVFGKSH